MIKSKYASLASTVVWVAPILFLSVAGCATAKKNNQSEIAAVSATNAETDTSQPDDGRVPTAPQDSAAYQLALNNAFGELQTLREVRQPADSSSPARVLPVNLEQTQRFQVTVYPKSMIMNDQPDRPRTTIQYGAAQEFQFRINRIGGCASAGEMISANDRANCLQVDIRPLDPKAKGKQFVRIFINKNYQAYGVAYHDFKNASDRNKGIRAIKWDPTEPLSADMMPLAHALFPLDLPIYATNGRQSERGSTEITAGPRKGQSCDGFRFRYKNVYGSRVSAAWCVGDAWPTVVDTDRYTAVLKTQM